MTESQSPARATDNGPEEAERARSIVREALWSVRSGGRRKWGTASLILGCMHTGSSSTTGEDHVQAIASHLLRTRLDELTDTALARLMDEEPAYAALTMDAAVRRRGMYRTLELALTRLSGGAVPPLDERATAQVGRERAEQGFPLPALMHSFQLDLRILWEAVLQEGRTRGISTEISFQDALIRVWEATDANTVEVVQAYRRTEQDIAQARDELRARAFERLVRDSDHDPSGVAEAASLLNLPTNQPVLVLSGEGLDAASAELRRCRDALSRSSTAHHLAWMADELVGVLVVGRRGEVVLRSALEELRSGYCGVARADDLAATARGLRLARAARRGARAPGMHALETRWVDAMATGDDELGEALARDTLGPLLAAPERDALLESLRAYLEIGSVIGVAERTYRHRNTVRNRLRHVEALCQVNLEVPRDVARLSLALSWWDARGAAT